jgi:hypothetical protein
MAFESLTIDLNARLAKFETELRKVGTSVERHAKQTERAYKQAFDNMEAAAHRLAGVLGVGLTIGGLAAFARDSVSAIAALDDLSEKTGLTVELLDQLGQVATIGGHSLDDVAGLASKFAKNVALAAGGNKELLKTFEELGISQEQLQRQAFDETFLQFARAVATAENQVNAIARAQVLAGKAAAEQIPFFRDLAEEGLRGARVTEEQAAAADKFEKNLKRLSLAVDSLKIAIGNELVEQLNRVADAMIEAAKQGGVLHGVWQGLISSMSESFGSKAANDLGRVVTQLEGAERVLANLQAQAAAARPSAFAGAIAQQEALVKRLRAERAQLQALVDIETPGRVFGTDNKPAAARRRAGEATGISSGGGAAAAERKLADMFEQRRAQLEQELQRTQQLTVVEQLLADLQTERYARVTPAQRDALIALAAQVDLTRENMQVQKEATEAAERAAAAQQQAIERENERLEAAAARWRALIDPTEEYRRKIAEIAELVNREKLTPEEGQIALESEAAKLLAQMNILGEQTEKTNDIARDLGLTFSSAFEDAVIKGEKFSDVLRGIEQDLLRMLARELVTKPLFEQFDKLLKGFGAGAAGGDLFSSIFSGIGGLFGFQHGGSFTVGGSGGPDSKIVAFRATPGEQVTVAPPGQGGGVNLVVNFNSPVPQDRRSQLQVAGDVGRAAARATRRNG